MSLQRIASTADVPPGEVRVFVVDDRSIALANVNGAFYAVDNICTHDGGPLGEGRLAGDLVECPRHGARFDVKTGQVRAFPAVLPVRTYPVTVSDNEISIEVA